MATMTINIINPNIDLISKVREDTSDCTSVFNFEIKSTPYTDVTISLYSDTNMDEYFRIYQLDSARGSGRGRGMRILYDDSEVRTDSEGIAKIRLVFENYATQNSIGGFDPCNTVRLTVTDPTNNKSEVREFTRCGGIVNCGSFGEPITQDDNYTVGIGNFKLLPVMENDDTGSSFTSATPNIESQPSHGNVEVMDSGEIKYTHTGTTPITDAFTYSITTQQGKVSNTSTVIIDAVGKTVDNSTIVNIFFDATASMTGTLPMLQRMVETDGALYNKLSPYYESDAEYFNKVTIRTYTSEKAFLALSDHINTSGKTINLVFQDEADPLYHYTNRTEWTINDPRMRDLMDDIVDLRRRIGNISESDFNAVLFEVTFEESNFQLLLKAIEAGNGQYTGEFSFTDINNIKFKYNVLEAENVVSDLGEDPSQYYADLIVEALEELGFSI